MNVFSKSTLRAPLLYLFLSLVIAAVTFAFVAKAVEFLIVQRETARLEGYYRAIGEVYTLRHVEGKTSADGIALLADDPKLAFIDHRRYSSGVMQDFYNTDFNPGTSDSAQVPDFNTGVNNLEFWFLGTLVDRRDVFGVNAKGEEVLGGLSLTVDVDKILEAYPDLMYLKGQYGIFISLRSTPNAQEIIEKLKQMEVGKRYLLRGWVDPKSYHPSTEPWINAYKPFYLRALNGDSLYYLPVPLGEEQALESPEFAALRNNRDLLRENLHAVLLTASSDMSALPWVQESARDYKIEEGRWLNAEDESGAGCPIVITADLAATRGLSLGDTSRVRLRGLKDPYFGYIRGEDKQAWAGYPSFLQNFEIVGVYSDAKKGRAFGHVLEHNQAYITQACLPEAAASPAGVDPTAGQRSGQSFVLADPRVQADFLAKYQPALSEMGLAVRFGDNNAKNFFTSSDPIKAAVSMGLVINMLVLVLALGLAAFLYQRQQQRNYAIARALGVPQTQASRQMLSPLLLLGLLTSLAGALGSWNFALDQATQSLSKIPTPAGVTPALSLGKGWFIGFWLLSYGVLLLISLLVLKRIQARSVVELLRQGAGTAQRKQPAARESPALAAPDLRLILASPPAFANTHLNPAALLGFGRSQILRSTVKTLLALALGLGFVLALGWLQSSILQNKAEIDRLYLTTEVKADLILGGLENMSLAESEKPYYAIGLQTPLKRPLVDKLMGSPYVKNALLTSNLQIFSLVRDAGSFDYKKVFAHWIFATNDWNFLLREIPGKMEIKLLPGYDETFFAREWTEADLKQEIPPLIVPKGIQEDDQLELGDEVTWWDMGGRKLIFRVVGTYEPEPSQMPKESTLNRDGEQVLLGSYGRMFAPISAQDLYLDGRMDYGNVQLRIDPRHNRRLPQVKDALNTLLEQNRGFYELDLRFWDEELLSAVQPLEKNLSLLEVLYPVTVAVSMLIGFGLSLALVLQQARESALLRMLGVGALPLRLLLSGTQLLLALAGVLVGLGLLALLRGPAGLGPQAFAAAGLYLAGVLLGTLLGATLVSRRKPMELLQVKE